MLRNLSTGIEASATGESLNSGDVAVHPAARHKSLSSTRTTYAATYGSGPSLLRSTQHTAVTLFVRSIQQSLLRSIQQSLFFYAAVAPSPPAAVPLFRTPSLLPEEGTGSAHVSELLKFLRFI